MRNWSGFGGKAAGILGNRRLRHAVAFLTLYWATAATVYASPLVTLTSPGGSSYTTPVDLVLAADAEPMEDGARITKVEFYVNGALKATDTSFPYSYTWFNTPAGAYLIHVVGYDNLGGTGGTNPVSVSVSPPANQAPTVSLTSPSNGAVVPAGAAISLAANASDSDGSIAKVEFYDRGTLMFIDTTAPYAVSWTPNTAGPYEFSARAYDNSGGAANSGTAIVSVNYPPSAYLTAPASGALYQAPASITLEATTTDPDGSPVGRVEFYNGGTLLWTDTSAPFTYTWTNVSRGSYNLSARVYDIYGASGTSAVSQVAVNQAPTVSLSSPVTGAVVSAPGSVLVQASASDIDDSISKVEFYRNGSLISTDTAAPFEVQWTGLAAATYTLSAKAYDTRGGVTSTANASLIVNAAPTVSLTAPTSGTIVNGPTSYTLTANAADSDGSISKVEFYSGATLLATDTSAPYSFTWSNINPGSFSITAKATDDRGAVVTTAASSFIVNAVPSVSITAPANGAVVTAPANVQVTASASDADDGVAMVEFYSNGTKIATDTAAPFVLQWNNVPAGTYSLTAKAYDNRGGATTSAASSLIVNTLPSVTLTSPASGTTINAPNSYTLNANASDSDGTITQVEFYSGTTLLATDTTAPYSYVWSNIPAGTYSITAKAIDNRGGARTSTASTLILNAPPAISISSPTSGTVVVAPASVLIQTSASDVDDSVAMVEFYVNGQLTATDTAAPFTLQADNMPAGTYTLTAKAYDGRGGATMSAPVTLVVNERPQVQLVSPANNAGVVIPKTITLAATASDSDGSISKVEFYNGAALLGTATSAPYQLSWTVNGAGDYSLTARAYDNRGTTTTSAVSLLRARLESFELIQDGTITNLSSELPAHDPSVGTLAGTPGVSGGSASYSIPIVIPPGRRGMAPQFALSYSSRGGNGIAGMGWSLSGLSSVHRCPSTLAQDGQIRPVQLDASDRLCLDGQRLVATAGAYSQAGTTYGTELESFVRVTQLGGSLASDSSYFKVERKSGEISYYGNGVNGRVIPGGNTLPLTWMVNRTEDRIGNFIEYRYTDFGNGEVLIDTVLYTGFGTTVGDRKVQFVYEARPTGTGANDMSSSYLAGGVTLQTKRLKSVVTSVGSEFVRQLLLNYTTTPSSTTGRSLLDAAYDCAYDGTQWICKTPTRFTWQQGAPTYRLGQLYLDLGEGIVSHIQPAGDFDGDGAAEVIVQHSTGYYLVSLTPERQIRWKMTIPTAYVGLYTQQFGDFNQDGRVDIVGTNASQQIVIRVWSGPATANTFDTAFATEWNTGVSTANGYVKHMGDMDGDGRADLVVYAGNAAGNDSCRGLISIYKNTPNPASPQSAPTFPLLAQHCMAGVTRGGGLIETEGFRQVRDFDGDGLPDIWVDSIPQYGPQENGDRYFSRVVFGQRAGGYSLQSKPFSTLFSAAYPALSGELKPGLFSLWADVNGDGLDDFIYARHENGGKWTLRLNRGGFLGARYAFGGNTGIGRCATKEQGSSEYCTEVWKPWLAGKISVGDIDGDGRMEILAPTRFAANICVYMAPDPGQCPLDDGNNLACKSYYACPEDPATGNQVLGLGGKLVSADGNGVLGTTPITGYDTIIPAHYNGMSDYSTYFMTALRFVETAPGVMELRDVPTDVVSNDNTRPDDIYGDGHTDYLTSVAPPFSGPDAVAVPIEKSGGVVIPESQSPRSLPGGIPLLTPNLLINENRGPGGTLNPDGKTPQTQDVLAMVTDGLGVQTVWTHYPLSSEAGRGASDTPLYDVTLNSATRYVDENHIYFTSSMPVVSEMIRSDGVGDYRAWRYGYSEAMYNTRGRGFQGFRRVIEEDLDGGARTTSIFHQKFPLTGQLEEVVMNPLVRPGTTGAIRRDLYQWRCNRADRSDTAACSAAPGGSKVFPYLDSKESWTFDATTAANPSGGTSAAIGYTQEVNADDTTCTGSFSSQSGFDAYGNLTAHTVHTQDVSTGSGGFRAFLSDQCQRTQTSYTVDTSTWWLDRLDQKTVTASVSWDATQHPLPAGTANPTKTIVTQYSWNTDRTPATEIFQPGIAKQQRAAAYVYTASPNYGLPTGVGVSADGDPNGTRNSGTAYSADGYFPRVLTNALNHGATTEVRARDGQPYLSTDPNGLRTFAQYDAFGTLIRNQYRGRTDAEYLAPDKNIAVTRCNGACGPLYAAYAITEVQDGAPTKVAYLDMLGRPVQAKTRLSDGAFTYVSTVYNARGQVDQQSGPYKAGETTYWTTFGYDLIGRMTSKSAPQANHDGRGDRLTTYTYSGRQTQIRVCGTADTANCLNLSRTTDTLGRYVETLDAKGGRTRFWYDPAGSALDLEDAKGVVTRATYNAIGQRTSVNDPNQGVWNFTYDALGELLVQTDARLISTNFAYDKLGRPTSRTASVDVTGDGTADAVADTWTYDQSNALGQPATTQRTINGTVERSSALTYDALVRPVQTDVTQALTSGTQSYRQRQKYDGYYGRPTGQEYPNGESVEFLYTAYGHALRERDPATGVEYRATTATDARGNITGERFADANIADVRQYVPQTGQLSLVQYNNLGGSSLRKLEYRYDIYGNLASQSLNGGSSFESYHYDELQRLTDTTRTGAATGTTTYGYDAVGNFTFKSDFSTTAANAYSYTGGACGGGPNAIKSVQTSGETRTYCFDANGNLTADSVGLSVKYDHQNLPVVTQRGASRDDFRYGSDGQRTRSWGSDGARVYLQGYEHRTDTGETKVYLGDYAVISRSGSTRKVEYLLKDRLGSVDAVADGAGVVTETRGYDAFGKPRSGTWADLSPAKLQSTATTPKGFTQHEHLNQVELIHMNGRVFDYNLGRFTGVDPFIQFPLNSQSLNPYSYLMNNPLSGTDPTGYAQDCADASNLGGCNFNETGSHITKSATIGVGKSGNPEFVGKGTVGGKLITNTGSISAQWSGGSGGKSTSSSYGADNRQQQGASASDKGAANTSGSNANGADGGSMQAMFGGGDNPTDKGNAKEPWADVTLGAPKGIKELLSDPATRQAALEKMVARYGHRGASGIVYSDQINPWALADADPFTKEVTFYRNAFFGNYSDLASVMFHEFVHIEQFKRYEWASFIPSPGSVGWNLGEYEATTRSLSAENPFSRGMSSVYRNSEMQHQRGYFHALPSSVQKMAKGGDFNCFHDVACH